MISDIQRWADKTAAISESERQEAIQSLSRLPAREVIAIVLEGDARCDTCREGGKLQCEVERVPVKQYGTELLQSGRPRTACQHCRKRKRSCNAFDKLKTRGDVGHALKAAANTSDPFDRPRQAD